MSLHESQSLLIEMQVCRVARVHRTSPRRSCARPSAAPAPAWEADNLYRLNTRVERSFIRVDADEVTYPAHVILRYRLERALIAGDSRARRSAGAWNDGMRELLGIVPARRPRGLPPGHPLV